MYMLRAISGVLHQDVGPAVPDSALDLRLGELAVVVPLVLCLLGLSAYPALISGRAFGGNHASAQVNTQLAAAVALGRWATSRFDWSTAPTLPHDVRRRHLLDGEPVIVKPHVDWFSLSPTLALLAATGLLLMVAVFTRRTTRKAARRLRRLRAAS